jgi:hypothetical protein
LSGTEVSASKTYRRLLGYARVYWGFGLVAVVGMLFDAAASATFDSEYQA